ncbi:MAG: hypothetical protein HY809_01275 [Nitrospirae bacterium]|nr:hypothetical protein [Nitrospirota bacterium]
MKRFLKKLEAIFSAAAFAESGETETAKEIMREICSPERRKTDTAVMDNMAGVQLAGTAK